MAANTLYNVGIRRSIKKPNILGWRNFEPVLAAAGTIVYVSNTQNLWFMGTVYPTVGTVLPYDAGGATFYSPAAVALLQFYWDQEFISPTT